MLIRYPPHSKSQRKNLSSYSSNQQTLVLKRRFQYNMCKTKIITLLHAYVQCVYIVSAKYQIAPLKAVVEVDWPIKAPSMHIQKPY